jgi:hypothetical protein
MIKLSLEKLKSHRVNRYRLNASRRLTSLQDAVQFVKERGFVFFWPIKNVDYPSLWNAAAGDRVVADAHDDPGHATWGWKDESLGKKIWYYGKIIRKKATMIDLSVAPYFYALSQNFGSPEEDILIQYQEGRLTREEKSIFDAILENGPMDTVALRRATHMNAKESDSRFARALANLQSDFKLLPVGISDSGGWRYAFIYELVHRYYPELLVSARHINENDARYKLVKIYFDSVGASRRQDIGRFFQWAKIDMLEAIQKLVENGTIIKQVEHPNISGEWFAVPEVVVF